MLKQDDVQISHFSINDPFHNIKSRQITISLRCGVGDKIKRDIFLQHSSILINDYLFGHQIESKYIL